MSGFGDAIQKGLDADIPGHAIPLGLGRQMLTAPKANLQDSRAGLRKQGDGIDHAGFRQRHAGQAVIDQALLAGGQGFSLGPSIKAEFGAVFWRQVHAPRSSGSRRKGKARFCA
jgi:hypothetical protein